MSSSSLRWAIAAALLAGAGCKRDNSDVTDQASKDLREAQAKVTENSRALASNQEAIAQKEQLLAREQAAKAEREQLLAQQRTDLGSAQGTLQDARAAYATAVATRFAKLDASLAELATKTDAASKDAAVGVRARRDQLSEKLRAMAGAAAPSWDAYTKDVDVTFDAIERDLREAGK